MSVEKCHAVVSVKTEGFKSGTAAQDAAKRLRTELRATGVFDVERTNNGYAYDLLLGCSGSVSEETTCEGICVASRLKAMNKQPTIVSASCVQLTAGIPKVPGQYLG